MLNTEQQPLNCDKNHCLRVSFTECALIKQWKYTGYIDLEPGEWKKRSPCMSVLSLLKLIWHLLNKCSLSLMSLDFFRVWQGQQADATHLKEAHFSWPAMLIRAFIHNVAEVKGRWILLEKKACGPYQGFTSVWGDPAACHVQNVWLEECAGVCLCVCSSTHVDVTADWDFVIKLGVVASAVTLTFQLGDGIGSLQFITIKFDSIF